MTLESPTPAERSEAELAQQMLGSGRSPSDFETEGQARHWLNCNCPDDPESVGGYRKENNRAYR